MQQLPLEISPPPAPGFENFIAGANAEALARLRAAAAGSPDEPVIYLWGGAGAGRTHLLRAAVRAAAHGLYCGAGDVLPAAAQDAPPDLLALDDVGALAAAAQAEAFALVNRARDAGRCVIAAGDAPPAQLALREDLRSRLGWGLVYQLHPLGDDAKGAWLRAEAARRDLRLGEDVVAWLLARLPRDLASLSAVLALLDRHALARQRQVTLPLVREALQAADR